MNSRVFTGFLLATAGVLSTTAEVKAICVPLDGKFDSLLTGSGTTAGVIKNAGLFNGNYIFQLVSSQPAPPLDGTTISRLGIVTLTTSKGTVVWKNFGIANLPGTGDFGTKVDGVLAEYNNVDPLASTGIFAGATGIVFSTGFTKYNQQGYPIGFFGDVRGKVCIPNNAGKP